MFAKLRSYHFVALAGLLLLIASVLIFWNAGTILRHMNGETVLNDFALWMMFCICFGTGLALMGEAETQQSESE
jgi:hypothetical protein